MFKNQFRFGFRFFGGKFFCNKNGKTEFTFAYVIGHDELINNQKIVFMNEMKLYRIEAVEELEEFVTSNNEQLTKRQLVLSEFGVRNDNDVFKNTAIVASIKGVKAKESYKIGELIIARVIATAHKYQSRWYMDINITDLFKLSK